MGRTLSNGKFLAALLLALLQLTATFCLFRNNIERYRSSDKLEFARNRPGSSWALYSSRVSEAHSLNLSGLQQLGKCIAVGSIAIGTVFGECDFNNYGLQRPFPSPAASYAADGSTTLKSEYKLFDEVWNIVNDNFFDDNYNQHDWIKVRSDYLQRLKSGADEGKLTRNMLTLLGDKYTRVLDKNTYESLWKYDAIGIGALFQSDSGKRMYVAAPPLTASSAAKAGLQKGDEIYSINGKSTDGMTAINLLDLMSNDNSDNVVIEYARPTEIAAASDASSAVVDSSSSVKDDSSSSSSNSGSSSTESSSTSNSATKAASTAAAPATVTVTLQRSKEKAQNPVKYFAEKQADGKLAGYIKLSDFNSEAVPNLQAALSDLNEQGVQEIALDLRGNTGGGFQFALNIGGMFMNNKLMVTAAGKGDTKNEFRTSYGQGVQYRRPLVIITDGLSASASEVLTAGLRDNCRAVVAGEKTFGKGKIQAVFGLTTGEGLTMTVAQYLTPKSSVIQGQGIEPDIPLRSINPYLNALTGNALTQPDLRRIDFDGAENIIRKTCTEEFLDQTRDTVAPIL